jgi:hypothetical protein
MVTTRFNLLEGYRAYFDKEGDDEPTVSGLAVGVDTKKSHRWLANIGSYSRDPIIPLRRLYAYAT